MPNANGNLQHSCCVEQSNPNRLLGLFASGDAAGLLQVIGCENSQFRKTQTLAVSLTFELSTTAILQVTNSDPELNLIFSPRDESDKQTYDLILKSQDKKNQETSIEPGPWSSLLKLCIAARGLCTKHFILLNSRFPDHGVESSVVAGCKRALQCAISTTHRKVVQAILLMVCDGLSTVFT